MKIVPSPSATTLMIPLQSHPAFAVALRGIGRDAEALALCDGGHLLAQLVLIRRRLFGRLSIGLATRGPIWADDVPTPIRVDGLRVLRKAGLALVESEQVDPALPLAGFRQVATAAHVAEIGLTGSPDARIAALDPAWRNKWRKAQRAGLNVRTLRFDGDPQHWLLQREAAQRRERRYYTLPGTLSAAYAKGGPGLAVLFQADLDGKPVAAMLILVHGRSATYQIGWTGPKGREAAGHQLLLMSAADWLAGRGCKRLDLGTVDTETNPGLAGFKIGSGATVRRLGGSWIAIPGL